MPTIEELMAQLGKVTKEPKLTSGSPASLLRPPTTLPFLQAPVIPPPQGGLTTPAWVMWYDRESQELGTVTTRDLALPLPATN